MTVEQYSRLLTGCLQFIKYKGFAQKSMIIGQIWYMKYETGLNWLTVTISPKMAEKHCRRGPWCFPSLSSMEPATSGLCCPQAQHKPAHHWLVVICDIFYANLFFADWWVKLIDVKFFRYNNYHRLTKRIKLFSANQTFPGSWKDGRRKRTRTMAISKVCWIFILVLSDIEVM